MKLIPIPEAYLENFLSLERAFKRRDAAVVTAKEKATGKTVYVLAAVRQVGKETEVTPFAQLFDRNPYDLLDPIED